MYVCLYIYIYIYSVGGGGVGSGLGRGEGGELVMGVLGSYLVQNTCNNMYRVHNHIHIPLKCSLFF